MRKLSAILVVLLLAALLTNVSVAQGPSLTPDGTGTLMRGPGIEYTPGSLWSNGEWDGYNAEASELGTIIDEARTADDFWLDPSCPVYEITEIRGTLLHSSAEPSGAIFEIYADSGGDGSPVDPPLFTGSDGGYANVGTAFGRPVREYTFPTPGVTLAPGKYWVSVIGLGDGSYGDRAFFATSAEVPNIQLEEGYFKGPYWGYFTWTPLSLVPPFEPWDFAFDIDGQCAQMQPMFATHVRIRPSPDGEKLRGLVRIATGRDMVDNATGPTLPVPDAMVDVRWRLPDGTLILWTGQTDARGRVVFQILRDQPGTHRLCILNATHPNYTYEPELNWETCATVNVY